MPRAADKRLAQLQMRGDRDDWRRSARLEYRFIAAMCAEIYDAQLAAGLDPGTAPVWSYGDWCARTLRCLGDTPELRRADEASTAAADAAWASRHPGEPDPREELIAELDRIGRRYADGGTPDPEASIIEWYAWASMPPPAPDADGAAGDLASDRPASPAPRHPSAAAGERA